MAGPTCSLVVDIGNSRVKWGEVDAEGSLGKTSALEIDRPDFWKQLRKSWRAVRGSGAIVAVSSVNPPVAARIEAVLEERSGDESPASLRWYRSAAEVPISHRLDHPETAGADRALAVAAALGLRPVGRSCLVVSCGTAITIERITQEGIWQGGAITPGFGLSARALNRNTAQLPLINTRGCPPAWGNSTRPALEAGIFWGVIGAIRELLNQQARDLLGDPWIVWTGGDAGRIAGVLAGNQANIVPHLVLEGLIRVSGIRRCEIGN